jgi:long-chain acyl-CoA synthetase
LAVETVPQTIDALLEESARGRPDLLAVQIDGSPSSGWTYRQLWLASGGVAEHLRQSGVSKGDRVLLGGPNGPEWAAAFFGIARAGAVAVPLDIRAQASFIDAIAQRAMPRHALLAGEQFGHVALTALPSTDLGAVRSMASEGGGDRVCTADDLAELVFTSGTTGDPKGVMLTHRNITSNIEMCRPAFPVTPRNRVLSILPLSHMFEQLGGLLVPLSGGASIVYAGSLRPEAIFAALAGERITNMTCVPQVLALFREGIEREVRRAGRWQQFQRLAAVARRLPITARRLLFRHLHARLGGALEYFVCGGAYLDPSLARWWESLGIKVAQGYGMTEASPVVATNILSSRDQESVGRPLPGIDLRIAADHEIQIRGPNVSSGYWRDPEATDSMFSGGWYKTGDLGFLDRRGRLHLIGRKKNVIVLSNGLNVYPEDIEHVLLADPRVKDAVVLGVASGQDVEVHAVLLTDHAEEAHDIVRRANRRLAPHQQIRRHTIWPDAEFPLTPTLKPKRGPIAERIAELERERRHASVGRRRRN